MILLNVPLITFLVVCMVRVVDLKKYLESTTRQLWISRLLHTNPKYSFAYGSVEHFIYIVLRIGVNTRKLWNLNGGEHQQVGRLNKTYRVKLGLFSFNI